MEFFKSFIRKQYSNMKSFKISYIADLKFPETKNIQHFFNSVRNEAFNIIFHLFNLVFHKGKWEIVPTKGYNRTINIKKDITIISIYDIFFIIDYIVYNNLIFFA